MLLVLKLLVFYIWYCDGMPAINIKIILLKLFMWTQLCLRYVTLLETRDYCDLSLGVQVMSACLVDVSVAGRIAIVLWLSV